MPRALICNRPHMRATPGRTIRPTGKAPACKLSSIHEPITYRAVPLGTVQDSLHGASGIWRGERVVTRPILHQMYHQCGNTDTYLSSCLPPLLLWLSPLSGVSIYRHGVIHPPVRDLTGAQSPPSLPFLLVPQP